MAPRHVFVAGATGYLGSRLVPLLLSRGHAVTALVRPGSAEALPPGITLHTGNALDPAALSASLGDCDTFVQLIGTPKPAPWKGAAFRAVDRQALLASLEALPRSRIRHYVYLSVAHPAPLMRAYITVRQEGEASLRDWVATNPGTSATFMRPWYVLGPGHRWALLLTPVYRFCELLPATREGALRTGLVSIGQMLAALVKAVEHPPENVRVVEVPTIRSLHLESA